MKVDILLGLHHQDDSVETLLLNLILSRNKVAVPEGAAGTPPFWSDAQSKSEILKLIINNYKLKTLCTNKLKVGSFDMLHKNLLHYA